MANSPSQLNGCQSNFPHRLQMDWNRKRGVKLLKSVGSQVKGAKNVTFLAGPTHNKSNRWWKVHKNRRSHARETMASLYRPSDLCVVLAVHQRFLQNCWTDLNETFQADSRWAAIVNVCFKLLKSFGMSGLGGSCLYMHSRNMLCPS